MLQSYYLDNNLGFFDNAFTSFGTRIQQPYAWNGLRNQTKIN